MKICQKNTPSMKNLFLMLKAEMAKKAERHHFRLSIAEFILQFYCEGVRFQRWLIIIFLIIRFTQSREKYVCPEN